MARRDLEEENCSLKKENQRFRMEREIWGGENPYDLAQKFNPVFIPMMF